MPLCHSCVFYIISRALTSPATMELPCKQLFTGYSFDDMTRTNCICVPHHILSKHFQAMLCCIHRQRAFGYARYSWIFVEQAFTDFGQASTIRLGSGSPPKRAPPSPSRNLQASRNVYTVRRMARPLELRACPAQHSMFGRHCSRLTLAYMWG